MKRHRRSRFRLVFSLAVIATVAVCASARAGQVSARAVRNPDAAAAKPAADSAAALHRRIARLRRNVSASEARQGEPFARTAEEAKQKIIDQMIAAEMQRASSEPGWDVVTEAGCSSVLSIEELEKVQSASQSFVTFSAGGPEDPPAELHLAGGYPRATTDLQGAHQAAQEILGRERYLEVFRSCNETRLASNRKDRITGVRVIAAELGLSAELTASIEKLVEEKDMALEAQGLNRPTYLDDGGSLVGPGGWGNERADEWSQEKLHEWSKAYEEISDRYNRRFRDLLGPELWEKYKQSFTDESWETPWQRVRLRDVGGGLFQKPLDESELAAASAEERAP